MSKKIDLHHNSRKPRFRCGRCLSTFISKVGLQQHYWVHQGAYPHICDLRGNDCRIFCGTAFRYRHQYKIHLRKIHKNGNVLMLPSVQAFHYL